ncbi:MAG: hypothetical protein CVU97_07230 [Firmicutes bacterium HGW-Firmicutes-21]|nr:MAG: hypothetical protein CVU97_07230 [Firmicutes bacterium HGW-Firmicutes-21]
MGKRRRRYKFTNGLNGVDRYYYPFRFTPPELDGSRYLNINPDFIGQDIMYSDTDPNGSYTGVPRDDNEVPVQDADDL